MNEKIHLQDKSDLSFGSQIGEKKFEGDLNRKCYSNAESCQFNKVK